MNPYTDRDDLNYCNKLQHNAMCVCLCLCECVRICVRARMCVSLYAN